MIARGLVLWLFLLMAVPALPAPSASGKDEVVASWQIEHPALTGLISGLTLGLWPGEYASDRRVETATFTMHQGYGREAFEYVRRHNERIFRFWRAVGMSLWGVAAAALSFRLLRRAKH